MNINHYSISCLVLLCFLFGGDASAQNVNLNSQADVDAFDTTITAIIGILTISGSAVDPIVDLSNLSNIQSVGGDVNIFNTMDLTNIDGLSGIEHIGGSLSIMYNYKLKSVGLTNLDSIKGSLIFDVNDSLLTFEGLSHLKYIQEDLKILNNFSLENLDGLEGVNYVGRDLIIDLCPKLTSITGLSNITSSIRDLRFATLTDLTNVDGLEGITIIRRDLYLNFCGFLNLHGLSGIQSVARDVTIKFNHELGDCHGLDCVLEIPGNVGGAIDIIANDTGCDSWPEVLDASRCGDGFVFLDVDKNCQLDLVTHGVANRRAIVQPGSWVLESDGQGRFDLQNLPAGNYTMELDTSGPWSAPCDVTRDFEISASNPIIEIESIPITSDNACHLPEISMHMSRARPCRPNQPIVIEAGNNKLATGALSDAYVILTLDTMLTFENASLQEIQLSPKQFRFELGDLYPGERKKITVNVMVSCDVDLRQSIISKAELFPVDSCVYNHIPSWLNNHSSSCELPFDGSKLKIEGVCEGDSVFFKISNITINGMVCHSPIRYYVDTELQWIDSVLLAGNETRTFGFVADGRTLRMEVDQHPLHPGLSRPNATVEGCGNHANWTPGLVNDLYFDDADSFIDISCTEVTSSFDPNDKIGFPDGTTDDHRILPNQQMEYMIRFQNTGNDTAFKIVVRDTLDIDLNLLSVNPGAASHPYAFVFHSQRVVEWTFDNILLPDSNENEPLSHGFLTFEVLQNPDLKNGTKIDNHASIYFDFNDPVLTNTTSHLVDDGIDGGISSTHHEPNKLSTFKAIPNPTTGSFEIITEDNYYMESNVVSVLDVAGRIMLHEIFYPGERIRLNPEVSPGLYFVRVMSAQDHTETVKVIIQ